jgi:hypothetical protein
MFTRFMLLAFAGGVQLCTVTASAATMVNVFFDEFGTGYYDDLNNPLRGHIPLDKKLDQADPGPGGLKKVLQYILPFLVTGNKGDVLIYDDKAMTQLGDVLRFNGDGTVFVYSDDSVPPPADVGFPTAFYPAKQQFKLDEMGDEDNNKAIYSSTLDGTDGPGMSVGSDITYSFQSDGCVVVPPNEQATPTCPTPTSDVPEPSSFMMFAIATACLGLVTWSRRPA